MSLELINLFYIVATVLFIFGLKQLSSPATARQGNLLSAGGMLLAVVVTLFSQGILSYGGIFLAMAAGGAIGYVAAQRVAMTSMPRWWRCSTVLAASPA